MDEMYVEQIVEKKPTPLDGVLRVCGIAVPALIFLAGLFVFGITVICIGVILAFACYCVLPRLNVEYEYLYLSKEFSVDRIFNKEKRKKAGEFPLSQLEIMAPVSSHGLDSYTNRIDKTLDFSSKDPEAKVYAMIFNNNGFTKVLVEPNEEMLKAIKREFPRKVMEY